MIQAHYGKKNANITTTKNILFMDDFVPSIIDCGSKWMLDVISMLKELGYNIYVYYFFDDSNAIISKDKFTILNGTNVKRVVKNTKFDYMIFSRPENMIVAKTLHLYKKDDNVVYVGHDLHFKRLIDEYNVTKNKHSLKMSKVMKRMETTCIMEAGVNYYPSLVEVDYVNNNIKKDSSKHLTIYTYKSLFESQVGKEKKDLLFVGSGHMPNRDAITWFIDNVMPLINENISLNIVGSICKVIDVKPNNRVNLKGFVSDEELTNLYSNSKIVIIPLRYGAGVKGKLIEALYYNSTVVTNSVGIEGTTLTQNDICLVEGFDPKAWADTINELYMNNEKQIYYMEKAKEYINKHHSYENEKNRVKEVFKDIK